MEDDTNVTKNLGQTNERQNKNPWKPRKEKNKPKRGSGGQAFIENITEKVMVQLIHTMNENQIDIKVKILVWR